MKTQERIEELKERKVAFMSILKSKHSSRASKKAAVNQVVIIDKLLKNYE